MKPSRDLSTAEAARELEVSIKTVQQWMEKGVLSGWKTTGGHRRVSIEEVRRLVQARRHARRSAAQSTCTVLIIEDDPDLCRLYEIMSRSWRVPVEMHFANNGLAGLIAVGRVQPQFVVVDLNIPKVDGYQLVDALNIEMGTSVPRYCVVTGMTLEEVSRKGNLPEQCPVLTKPVDFETLEAMIRRAHAEALQLRRQAVPGNA